MKLHATVIPYSGTVGGGLRLIDDSGQVQFFVFVSGATRGITKEETAAISMALINGIPDNIEIPDRIKQE